MREVDGKVTAETAAAAVNGVVAVIVLHDAELDLAIYVGVGVEGGEAGKHARVDGSGL
jgi:hypothetical protein